MGVAASSEGIAIHGRHNGTGGSSVGIKAESRAPSGTALMAVAEIDGVDAELSGSGVLALTARTTNPPAAIGFWKLYIFDDGQNRVLRVMGPSGATVDLATLPA
jgi:hypothetical protein